MYELIDKDIVKDIVGIVFFILLLYYLYKNDFIKIHNNYYSVCKKTDMGFGDWIKEGAGEAPYNQMKYDKNIHLDGVYLANGDIVVWRSYLSFRKIFELIIFLSVLILFYIL